MKKKIFILLLLNNLLYAQVQKVQTMQIGSTSTTTQFSSAALQIDDTSRGFLLPRMTTDQRNSIVSPAQGLTIFNTTKNSLEWYNGYAWYNASGANDLSLTSGGSAIVSAWTCNTASAGTLTFNTPVTATTQTLTANVIAKGDYSISATTNGVTFSASGIFGSIGMQNVQLIATGTPTVAGNLSFSLNTSPSCSFDRTVSYAKPTAVTEVAATSSASKTAVISFTPGDNGGDTTITYTVTSAPGGLVATGTSSPITVTGLTNGTDYTFTVVATNAAGSSPNSEPSNPVTPTATVPDPPTITSTTFGNASSTLYFTPPVNDGDSPITNYVVISDSGATASGTSSPITMFGLTNGQSYTFTIIATNSIGNSIPSSGSTGIPKTKPTAPVFTSITQASTTSATVVLNVVDNGGSAVTGYSITATPGNITVSSTSSSTLSLTGLTNGVQYTLTATATNSEGASTASTAILNMNKTGSMFTTHFNGVVGGVYTGTATQITHTVGAKFSDFTACAAQYISTQNSASDCPSTVTSFDGQRSYPTAYINGQCWLAQNIQDLPSPPTSANLTSGSAIESNGAGDWAGPYSLTAANTATHGFLYQFNAAMNRNTAFRSQGVCPTGWHIPSVCEYRYLVFGLGYDFTTGSANGSNTKLVISSGTSVSGFNGTLSGYLRNGAFSELGTNGYYRISDFGNNVFLINTATIVTSGVTATRAHSVRCIKN